MNIPSKLLENAVEQIGSLPGIGKKTALRLVLHLLERSPQDVQKFSDSFTQLKLLIKKCNVCSNLSDFEICSICTDKRRDQTLICVVEDIRDVMAIEQTQQYKGLYHVLGGIISPMDGIGPTDLNIENLLHRVASGSVKEVIIAIKATMEGETTSFYLYRKLDQFPVSISTLSRGLAVGDELEYTDEVTLGRSILQRQPFDKSLSR
ncbi:MAG: recombination mediator RecR [Flavobacteriales bacterium]